MSVLTMAVQGSGFAIIAGLILGNTAPDVGKVISIGTSQVHDTVQDDKLKFASSESANTEFIQALLSTGILVEVPKQTKVLDGQTGTEKSGAGGSAADQISFTTFLASYDGVATLRALLGTPVIVCVGLGKDTLGAEIGIAVLVGTMSDIERGTKGNEFISMGVTVTGKGYAAGASFAVAAVNAALADVTPAGSTPVVIPNLVSGDMTDLMAGKIVLVETA